MNLQDLGGAVRVEGNVVVTGPVGRSGQPGSFVDVLRVLGSGGEYRVLFNEFDSDVPNAAVVPLTATANAEVRHNEIRGSMATDKAPGPFPGA